MSNAATRLIVIYRNYLSSYKGFSCAHRVLKGSSSCSEYGLKCTERYGVVMGSRLTLRRLLDCREVHQKWVQSQEKDDDEKDKENDSNKSDLLHCGSCIPFDTGIFELCACIP